MKLKYGILTIFSTIFLFVAGNTSQAAEHLESEINSSDNIRIEARGINLQFEFNSYPPKYYKGLKLLHVKKVNNNYYIGIYS